MQQQMTHEPLVPDGGVTSEELKAMLDLRSQDEATARLPAADPLPKLADVAEGMGISLEEAACLLERVRSQPVESARDKTEAGTQKTVASTGPSSPSCLTLLTLFIGVFFLVTGGTPLLVAAAEFLITPLWKGLGTLYTEFCEATGAMALVYIGLGVVAAFMAVGVVTPKAQEPVPAAQESGQDNTGQGAAIPPKSATQIPQGEAPETGQPVLQPLEAYCVKCRAKREIKDAQAITMKNGAPAVTGTCPVCVTKLYRFRGPG